jgi:hypothetical protein
MVAVAAGFSVSKMTIETSSDTQETDPFGAVVRTYRAYRLDIEGRTSGPPLLFEARDDAAAVNGQRTFRENGLPNFPR